MDKRQVAFWIVFLLLFCGVRNQSNAQELIFEKKVDKNPYLSDFGPNRKHFCHAFVSTSLTMPAAGQSAIHTSLPLTGQIAVGFRYKFKIIRPISILAECGINRTSFRVDQEPGKLFPDSLIHRSQSIRTNGLFGGVFLRIRLGQKGDYLGKYVDLGLATQASVRNYLQTRDLIRSPEPDSYQIEKTTLSRFNGIIPFSYKASIRLGLDRFSLIASYRLSRLLKPSWQQDLPGFELGFEVSPVRY